MSASAPDDPMSLAEGTRLGRYEIRRAVGAGGMGEVYEAIDTRLDRRVAVKVLPPDRAADAEARARFDREARAIAALNHPNICALYDVGQSDGHDYLVMELLEGETLQHRLQRGPLAAAAIVELAIATADALETAHAAGLIHRDLKPANIFITTRGVPKILDFGLAKTFADHQADVTRTRPSDLTGTGAALGTVAYMSPEQLRAEPLDGRTDLFSLGVVLYEMAAGRNAFGGATSAVVAAAILGQEPEALRVIRPDLPHGFETVVSKALQKDRGLRYQTAAALKGDLKSLVVPSSARAAPVRATASRSRGLAFAALGLAVVAIAASAFFMTRERQPPPVATPSAPDTLLAEREPDRTPEPAAPVAPLPPAAAAVPPARAVTPSAATATPVPPPPAATATGSPDSSADPASDASTARGVRGRAGRGAGLVGLAASLRGFPPQTYDLVVQSGDPEAREMGGQLRTALDAAGWTCANTMEVSIPQDGIAVVVPEPSPAATALVNWARRNGLAPAIRTMPGLPRMRIVIAGRRTPQ